MANSMANREREREREREEEEEGGRRKEEGVVLLLTCE